MAKWIKKQTLRVKSIVASAIDLDEVLGDALCNMTTASSLDLIYMTTELEGQPYTTRPYVWDLVHFLQKKLLKVRKHAILNGLASD
jgi:selenophosphate synthetase-related protein